jgi:hypothetical protein
MGADGTLAFRVRTMVRPANARLTTRPTEGQLLLTRWTLRHKSPAALPRCEIWQLQCLPRLTALRKRGTTTRPDAALSALMPAKSETRLSISLRDDITLRASLAPGRTDPKGPTKRASLRRCAARPITGNCGTSSRHITYSHALFRASPSIDSARRLEISVPHFERCTTHKT